MISRKKYPLDKALSRVFIFLLIFFILYIAITYLVQKFWVEEDDHLNIFRKLGQLELQNKLTKQEIEEITELIHKYRKEGWYKFDVHSWVFLLLLLILALKDHLRKKQKFKQEQKKQGPD